MHYVDGVGYQAYYSASGKFTARDDNPNATFWQLGSRDYPSGTTFLDVDRDGFVDIVTSATGGIDSLTAPPCNFRNGANTSCQRAGTTAFLLDPFEVIDRNPSLGGASMAPSTAYAAMLDRTQGCTTATPCKFFSRPISYELMGNFGWDSDYTATFADIDGDGGVDWIVHDASYGTWQWYRAPSQPAQLLSTITVASGMKQTITYAPSSAFDARPLAPAYPVVWTIKTEGPALTTSLRRFWYSEPLTILSDTRVKEYIGFRVTTVQDDTTFLVQQTTWGTEHWSAGMPLTRTVASAAVFGSTASAPPVGTVFFSETHQPSFKPLSGSAQLSYPAVVFDKVVATTESRYGTSLSSNRTIDVDVAGNVISATINGGAAAPPVTYRAVFDPTAGCRRCPVESVALDGTTELMHQYFHYDAPVGQFATTPRQTSVGAGHLNYVEELVSNSPSPTYEIAQRMAWNANGSIAGTQKDYPTSPFVQGISFVRTTITYDPLQLVPAHVETTDGLTTLFTDYGYDVPSGKLLSVTGPSQTGAPGPTVGYVLDDLFRPVVVARTAGALPGTAAVTITAPVSATKHVAIADLSNVGTSISSAGTYEFESRSSSVTVNRDYTVTVAASQDVSAVVHYFDGAGRQVQVRRQLNSGGTAAADAAIVVALDSAQFRVENAVGFDGAGRLSVALDPYIATGSAFADLHGTPEARSVDQPPLRAQYIGYDGNSRPSCQVYRIFDVYSPNLICQSQPAVTTAQDYQLATTITYGAATTPDGQPWFTTDVTPAWRNVGAAAPSQHQYADASGRIAYTRDDYGNFTQALRDALGRETRVVRFAGAVGSAPSLALALQYDGRGRLTRRTEPAAGTKLFQYLPTGELVRAVQGANGVFQDGSAGVEVHVGSLGRVVERKVFKVGQDANCGWTQPIVSDDTTFDYDAPYQTDAVSYPLTAGRMSAMHNDTVSIAFGYTDRGAWSTRDEWPYASAARVRVLRTLRNDGLPTAASFDTAFLTQSPVVLNYSYDTLSRIVRVSDGGTTNYWDAIAANSYDELDRLISSTADNGNAITAESYSPVSNALSSHSVTLSRAAPASPLPLYLASGMNFAGGKLNSFTQQGLGDGTPAAFTAGYDRDGRLASAALSGGGFPYAESYSFFTNGRMDPVVPSAPSFSNLEAVQTASGTSTFTSSLERLVSITVPASTTVPSAATQHYFTYDDRGQGLLSAHKLSPQQNPPQDVFSYDGIGRLTAMSAADAQHRTTTLEQIVYGPDGELATRTFPSGTDVARYYIGAMLTLVDRGIAGKLAYVHVGIPSRVASIWTSSTGTGTSGVIYYHRDPHGSVIATSQNGGYEGVAYRYTAFGDSKIVSGTEADGSYSELGYSGALRLSDGVLHMEARDYWPLTRRFLQPDSIDIRRYSYAGGDPVNRFDPTGHDDKPTDGIPEISDGAGGPGTGWGPLAPIIAFAGNCLHGDCFPDTPDKPQKQAPHFGAAPGIGSVIPPLGGGVPGNPAPAPTGPLPPVSPGSAGVLKTMLLGQLVHRVLGQEFVNDTFRAGETARFSDATINEILRYDDADAGLGLAGVLRPDLVSLGRGYLHYGEVYEIKPDSRYGRLVGPKQLAAYIALLDGKSMRRVFGPGKEWMPPTALQIGPTTWAYFRGPVNGVIYYRVGDTQDGTEAAALVAAGIGALLLSAMDALASGALVAAP